MASSERGPCCTVARIGRESYRLSVDRVEARSLRPGYATRMRVAANPLADQYALERDLLRLLA